MQEFNPYRSKSDILIIGVLIAVALFWVIDIVLEMGWLCKLNKSAEMFLDVFFCSLQFILLVLVWGVLKKRRMLEGELDVALLSADAEKKKTKSVLAAIGDAVCILDKDMRIIYQNGAHQTMTGNYAGRFCYETIHGRDRVCTGCGVAQTYLDGEVHRFENSVTLDNGTMRYVEIISSPIRDEAGCIYSAIETVRDITEQKQAAELVNRLNGELHRQAQELLAANRELEAFSFSLSHDLRNILTTMYLSVQELNEQYAPCLDETGRYFVKNLKESCEKMEEFVEAMQLLSGVSRLEMTRTDVDLGEVARQIFNDLCNQEPNRLVDFVITPPLDAFCDSHLLKVALENLLGNAWKYTANTGSPRIEFGSTEMEGARVYWVRDNGAGFSMKDAAKLFKPFQRLHRADQFNGSGIGLATVERIILRHGGRIWGEGVPDQGATFFFTLDEQSP